MISRGSCSTTFAVESDITPIKEAEQKLKKAIDKERELNKFKTQFISLASHQFRTPLAAIRSSSDVLELKSEENPDVASFMKTFGRYKQIMIEETVRMTEIMENILDISRMDEGKIDVAKKERSLKGFVDDFISSNPETQGQKRELTYSFDAPDQVIQMDEILIRNVLRNVVSNAFKYSAGMKAPELNVVQSGDGFEIRVHDYGGDPLPTSPRRVSEGSTGPIWTPKISSRCTRRLAREAGVQIHIGTKVIGFTTANGKVTGLETSKGHFDFDVVVDASGPWARHEAKLVGVNCPSGIQRPKSSSSSRPKSWAIPSLCSSIRASMPGRKVIISLSARRT